MRDGLTGASFFAGIGGSCFGLSDAGFQMTKANEFLGAAADLYEANHPGVEVDRRDIREVPGRDYAGLDLINGSPPCQAFSTSGSAHSRRTRRSAWGTVLDHADGTKSRSDDLFLEFIRVIREAKPRAFMAENVAGLARGAARAYLRTFVDGFARAGYTVDARILLAHRLGVPSVRTRLIIVGFRRKPDAERFAWPEHGEVACPAVQMADHLEPEIAYFDASSGLRSFRHRVAIQYPTPTILTIGAASNHRANLRWLDRDLKAVRALSVEDARRPMGLPELNQGSAPDEVAWARIGNAVPPPLARAVGSQIHAAMGAR